MNILELDSYDLADTVKFHDRLNPRLWDSGEHLHPEVKAKLMQVAQDFQEFLGVPDLDVKDITISGSNAAFNYTPASDIDLHIVIDIPDVAHDEVYRELFNAKKYQYNDEHDIRIRDADVELYAQDSAQPHHSQGIYSLLRNSWLSVPKRTRAEIDDVSTRSKFEDLAARIDEVIKSQDIDRMDSLMKKIKTMRQTGLEKQGEFGSDNLAFKLLRNNRYIKRLIDAKQAARDQELSLAELARPRQPVRYGFGETSLADMRAAFQSELKPLADPAKEKVYHSRDEYAQDKKRQAKQQEIAKSLVQVKHKPWSGGMYESPDGVDPTTKMFLEEPTDESPDGVNPTTAMFLTEVDTESVVQEFIQHTAERLGIERIPEIVIHHDPDWSESNHSFGMYVPDQHKLHVSLGDRHLLDVLRTTAHELCHCAQQESAPLPDNAGDTGSSWENEANAVAGIVMRDFANAHPEYFQQNSIKESASGYIPTKAQARDPRYSMALTVDIKPGQVGKEANKLNLKTDRQGRPALLMKTANLQESLAAEFAVFESQDLFEINMGSKNLRREAARTGAIAGMEFEMIVPNVEGNGDEDQEPNYEYDQRCRSIQDAYDFFYDGDWNSRRSCDAMRDSMRNDYTEWLDEKISLYWDSGGEEYVVEWVKNNVDESEWNPDDQEGEARNGALEEYATNVHADPVSDQYQSAYEEFREENQESYDESDWLDDADLSRMSEIENAYSMSWPHWQSQGGGEASIEDIAQEFENAIGRDVRASGNYHSGSVIRPSPTQIRYVVEPDGSLEPDNPGDQGLEFVSPPLPIDEILGDLNKVKAWAKEYGCYTNDSTGLHINISVPNYSRENLDFVKLALLMGDKYVLSAFGRSSNTYAKSALDIVKRHVRDNPEGAAALLDKMKGNLDQLASKAIHSGITSKYTSINTKDGHIEFRSPGGDWLDQNFDQIENTLLRFTVAMSAALNPDMYRQEYLTKLYKMLTENNRDDDTIKYFSDYVAGKIPKAALRSFVKQAQLQRNIRRGKTDGQKMWWKVYKDGKNAGRYGAMIEVVATSEKEAIDKAAKEWGLFSQEYKSQMDAEALRPYEEKPGSGTYELFDRRTGETIPDTEFSARNQEDVNTRVDDYINFGQHGLSTVDARLLFGARPVAAPADEPDQGPSANSLRPTGPGPWEVYNRATGNSTVNLIQNGQPITDRAQAQRQAMALISTGRHDLYGVRTVGTDTTTNIGTQTDMENRLGLPSQSATANYAVVDRQTLDPVFRFQADDLRAANRIYGEWLAATGLPATTEDYGFQEIRPGQPEEAESSLWAVRRISDDNSQPMGPTLTIRARDEQAARDQVRRDYPEYEYAWLDVQPAEANAVPEVPMDVAQNFPDRTDGRNIDYSFRDLFGNTDQASSASAGNSFSGQWRVMIDGEEVWRFRGVGNSQADANRIAQTWLQDQRSQGLLSPAPGADIEVLPVMTEGLTEYKNTPLQDYNGLQFIIDSNHPYLRVKAFAPGSGQQLAQVDFKIDDQDELHPEDLHVEERWRGQGIAKVMYDYVKSQGYTIHRSWSQTDAGSEFWNKHRGQKRVWEQGVAEGENNAMVNTASRLANKDDGKVAKLRAAGDKRREDQLKGRDIARRDRTSKDEWGYLKQGVAEEQLDELFQPGKQNWTWKIKADNEAIAKFTVGDRDYVWQAFSHFRDDKPHKWEIQFRMVKQSTDPEKLQVYGTTGTGNSAEVMSNAVDIMREFLQYYGDGVQQIAFDAKENSRIALYRKMIQRLLPNWNADEDYSSEYGLRFTLTRPKSMAQGSNLQEIATMPADQFAGGKDVLDYMPPPSKKRLRPLPGGTDLMYAIETMGPETRVQIVDPGVPGITRPVVVAVLNLDPSSLPNTVQVGSITVDEDYRGRGLAKSLYGIVLTIMRKNLVSGDSQTPGGRRNWLSLATIPGVEVQGLVRIPNQIFDMERTATVWRKYADRILDQIMELGGQFYSKDGNSTYWLFDVVPGKTSLKPAVQNALSRLYGYESDNLLLATWTGA